MSDHLSEEELKKVRGLLLADQRRQWVISSLAGLSKWIAGIGAGWFALKALAIDAVAWFK